MRKKILLCGNRSFAAGGLDDALRAQGHDVTCFTRGPLGKTDNTVFGPVAEIDQNPHLDDSYDSVINYILLKDEGIDENIAFIASLLKLCSEKKAEHLIHISSISVYKASEKKINEDALVEQDASKKGAYASLKVATENYVAAHCPDDIKLSLLRPGFVLGEGLLDPIVGTGLKTPFNSLLVLGNANSHIPLVSRDKLNQSLCKIVETPPEKTERLLLADSNSPTRAQYLDACNRLLGTGETVNAVPVPLWMTAAAGGELLTRVTGQSNLKVMNKISSLCRYQEFDATKTESRLGIDFSLEWEALLARSLDRQESNFSPSSHYSCATSN